MFFFYSYFPGEHSKITLNTKNVFIECTATDLHKVTEYSNNSNKYNYNSIDNDNNNNNSIIIIIIIMMNDE